MLTNGLFNMRKQSGEFKCTGTNWWCNFPFFSFWALTLVYTVGPPYPRVAHPWSQPTVDRKYLKKNFREFHKAKLEFAVHRQLFSYLHSIYIVFTTIYIAFTLY